METNILNYPPGTLVENVSFPKWGIGQVQSCINGKLTINFENVGKKVLNQDSSEIKTLDILFFF